MEQPNPQAITHGPLWTSFEKLGQPLNKLLHKSGTESFWPTPLEQESEKAARILKSFCSMFPSLSNQYPRAIYTKAASPPSRRRNLHIPTPSSVIHRLVNSTHPLNPPNPPHHPPSHNSIRPRPSDLHSCARRNLGRLPSMRFRRARRPQRKQHLVVPIRYNRQHAWSWLHGRCRYLRLRVGDQYIRSVGEV